MTTTETSTTTARVSTTSEHLGGTLPHPVDPAIPPFRDFTARQWVIEAARDTSEGWELGSHDTIVRIAGVQFATGRVKRWVEISGDTTLLPAEMVQQLGDALLAARNEIVRLSAADVFAPAFSDEVAR